MTVSARTAPRLALCAASVLFAAGNLSACGDKDEDSAASGVDPDAPTWHQDIRPLFETNCLGCHSDSDGLSGIPLDTWARASGLKDFIGPAVEARTMPPWGASSDCAEYEGSLALSDEDVDLVLAWVEAGAPEGDAADPAPVGAPLELPELAQVDLTLELPVDYTPTAAPDDYRCFLMDWPYEETTYVTGYQINPGNAETVHHVIPYIIAPGDVEAYRALDEADPDPGYPCYGGPGGDVQTLIDTRWLGAWAPGGGASVLPEGAGVRVAAGSVIALQMHYYVSSEAPGPDRSTMDLSVADSVELGSEVQPWTEVAWLFGQGMEIPAGESGVTHTFSYKSTASDGIFDIRSGTLHMHTLGRSGSMKVTHADGTESCIIDVPEYDFNWQRSYNLAEPVQVAPGDTIELSCTWDNPTDADVHWGDGTDDEMCLGVTLLTWER